MIVILLDHHILLLLLHSYYHTIITVSIIIIIIHFQATLASSVLLSLHLVYIIFQHAIMQVLLNCLFILLLFLFLFSQYLMISSKPFVVSSSHWYHHHFLIFYYHFLESIRILKHLLPPVVGIAQLTQSVKYHHSSQIGLVCYHYCCSIKLE